MVRAWVAALTIAVLAGSTPGVAARADTLIAVLPLAPASTGQPYSPLPTPNDLQELTGQLRTGFVEGGVRVIPLPRVAQAVASHGFAQSTLERSCAEPECAQVVGRAAGAKAVAFGRVTRLMALIWSTQVTVVDVHTGKQIAALQGGYKGGPTEMSAGETEIGLCLARVLTGKRRCNYDRGF
jgi:hypothetical protein